MLQTSLTTKVGVGTLNSPSQEINTVFNMLSIYFGIEMATSGVVDLLHNRKISVKTSKRWLKFQFSQPFTRFLRYSKLVKIPFLMLIY